MDGLSIYNQIEITPEYHKKTRFLYPWGTFTYRKFPFGLQNAGATFQWAMSYAFHDIKHIVQPYLDDPPKKYRKHQDHPEHLRQIFLCCQCCNIRLNPHKFIFVVESR